MLFIGIPTYNEATTIGVLLWRLRTVLSDVSREYEVVVYDDASTDDTADVLAPYARVLPLTLLRGAKRLGTGGATDAIVRHVARTTRYPRRDGLLLMQADFTDSPALVPEFLRRFEGGADLIIGERASAGDAPVPVRRLFAASRWVLRPFVGISEVRDLTSSFRLARIAVLRDVLKASGDTPIASGDGWMAQADFLLRAAPHARRVETIPVTPTFGVRTRATRRTAWPDTLALAKWGWSHRGQRVAAKVIARTVELPVELTEPVDGAEAERPERPERSERRERANEATEKRGRRERGGERRERGERGEPRDEAPTEARPRPARPPRDEAPTETRPRPARAPRSKRSAPLATAAEPVDAGVLDAQPSDHGAAGVDGVEAERSSRKRRRGKRGTKRTGSATDGAPHESNSVSDQSGAPARLQATAAPEEMGSEAEAIDSEGAPGEVREPKRRRARRGRRRRGEGRESDNRATDSQEGVPDPHGVGSSELRRDEGARDGGDRDADGEAEGGGGAEGDGEAEGDAAQRRRNRRGRRGGRRRTSRTEGGPNGEGDGGRGDGGRGDGGRGDGEAGNSAAPEAGAGD